MALLLGPLVRYVFLAAIMGLMAWVRLGVAIGRAFGSPETGALVAFWSGVGGVGVLVLRNRSRVGVTRSALVTVGILSSVGAGLLAAARLLRGTEVAEVLGLVGLLAFAVPLGWLFLHVLFGGDTG